MTTINSPAPATSAATRAREEGRTFLEIFALCGFAVAQPLLDIFGQAPSEFIFRNADSGDIVLFGLVVTVVPALVLWAVGATVGLVNATARRWVHLGILTVLATLFAVQILKDLSGVRGVLLATLAVAVGGGFAVLYRRTETTRTWLVFAAIGPVVFLGLFLFSSPTSDLLGGNEATAAQLDGIDNPAPVVLVVLDEFPLASLVDSDGNLDEELYPNFARFADIGTWYSNATAVTQYTSRSVPAILTGRYPEGRDDPLARDHPESLFTLLGGQYELSVDESTTRMCPSNLCEASDDAGVGADTGLGALLDDARDVWRAQVGLEDSNANPTSAFVDDADAEGADAVDVAISDDQELPNPLGEATVPQPERFGDLLDAVDDPGARLSYLHILLPHVPYMYLPDGTRYAGPDVEPGDDGGIWIDETAATDLGRQRELLQVGYTDALIGGLIDTMQEAGTWDDALVIVTADHGSAFLPGLSQRGLGSGNWNDALFPQIAWVPLFVHYPGQAEGETSGANVESVDIVPTVADVLGIDLPWDVDGLSMLDPDARPTNDKVFYESFSIDGHVDAGDRVEIDGSEYHTQVPAQGVDSLLAPAGEPLRFWRMGEGEDLVGRTVGEIGVVGTSAAASASLDQDAFTRDVDPQAASLPAYLSGHLDGAGNGETVAVALNGRVGGVGTTFAWNGQDHFFGVMLPPEFLVAGRNEIDVYLVRDGGLEPVDL